ncbi:MAG: MBL fold metallo-hydrolase [Candidatus Thorarchaeota archaeon]
MTDFDYPIHIEIMPHVHLIRGENRSRFPNSNSIFINDEILTLVDAGTTLGHIEKTLHDLGHELKDIDRIVLTHFHIDHKGNANRIWNTAQCEVLCHPLGESGIRSFSGFIENYGMQNHRFWPEWEAFFRSQMPHILEDYEVTGHFQDGKAISCGEVDLIPIYAPGHSKDHTCFGINGLDTILLVDIDLTKFGPWYGNAVGNIEDFKRSIQKIIDLEPQVGISSHQLEPIRENLIPRLEKYLAVFDWREQQILERVENGLDTIEKLALSNVIYPRFPHKLYIMFEEIMIKMHVDLLVSKGDLVWDNGRLEMVRK